MALFRVDFSGRGELADRQQKLAQMLSRLQKISEGKALISTQYLSNHDYGTVMLWFRTVIVSCPQLIAVDSDRHCVYQYPYRTDCNYCTMCMLGSCLF